jgi:hypothetical protein
VTPREGCVQLPRYFLHLWDGGIFEEDHEGTDLPSLAAAREEAVKFAHQISGEPDTPERALVEVADERGSTLWRVQLSSARGGRNRETYN